MVLWVRIPASSFWIDSSVGRAIAGTCKQELCLEHPLAAILSAIGRRFDAYSIH